MHQLNKILLLIAMIFLTSCSYLRGDHSIIQNRTTDYLKAKSIPPLSIPPGLSSSTITAHYPVSNHIYPGSNIPVDLTPPEELTSS
ncbi:MAG: bamC [Gammaproteobacteria bacterium]|jgi:uncharacterized lipoprotein|nr:bamC [Gammaproteobacteria bacterium]